MRLKRLIIHIGSDKAGSTAIQESLNANSEWYAHRSIYIPETGFMKMAGHPTLFQNIESPSLRRDLANEIRELENFDTALLSWEGVHFFGDDQRAELRSLIETCFPGIQVSFVYYIREQLSLIQSGLLQQVKQLALPPQTIATLAQPFDEIPADLEHLLLNDKRLFNNRIEAWRADFPSAEFIVRLFDRSTLVGGDVIDDFHYALGLELDNDFMRPASFANTSLTAEASLVLGEYFRFAWAEDDRRRIVDSALSFREGTSKYLHTSSQHAIRRYFAADNRALAAAFPSCSTLADLKTTDTVPIDPLLVQACRDFMSEQSQFPTQIAGSLSGSELSHLNFVSGWSPVNMRGLWSLDDCSVLQFRPRSMHFGGLTPGVNLNLSGKYPGRRSTTDEVVVNGRSYGEIDIFESEIFIPVELLDSTYRINVEFRHADRRPNRSDEPQRRFRLGSFDYAVLSAPPSASVKRPVPQ